MQWSLRVVLLAALAEQTIAQCRDEGSNCGQMAYLCPNQVYFPLLKQYCSKTCRFCADDCADKYGS